MTHRNRIHSDKRLVAWFQNTAFNTDAADWIWAVEHNHALAVCARSLHCKSHRIDKGVNPRPHILQVENQNVDIAEHLFGRFPHLAIKRPGHYAREWIAKAFPFNHVVLSFTANAMLRAKEGCGFSPPVRVKEVRGVADRVIDRRRMANQTNARIPQQAHLFFEKAFESERDVGSDHRDFLVKVLTSARQGVSERSKPGKQIRRPRPESRQ